MKTFYTLIALIGSLLIFTPIESNREQELVLKSTNLPNDISNEIVKAKIDSFEVTKQKVIFYQKELGIRK